MDKAAPSENVWLSFGFTAEKIVKLSSSCPVLTGYEFWLEIQTNLKDWKLLVATALLSEFRCYYSLCFSNKSFPCLFPIIVITRFDCTWTLLVRDNAVNNF